MTAWTTMALPALAAATLYFLPGVLTLLCAGQRGMRALYPAPLLSTGIIATIAVVYGELGIAFTPRTVIPATLLPMALFAVGRLVVARLSHTPFREQGVEQDRPLHLLLGTVAGLALTATIWVFSYARPMGSPDRFPQPYDVPFHFSVIKFILDTSNGSTLTAGAVDRIAGSTMYPVAWHDIVALSVQVTGASIPVAVAASCSVILTLVWPFSIMGLVIELFGHRTRWVLLALGLSGLFSTFPYRFVSYGVLYSNLLSYALLPALLAILIRILRTRLSQWASIITSVALILLGLLGLALAQPNSAFTLVVLALPLVVGWIFTTFATDASSRAQRLVRPTVLSIALVGLIAVAWVYLYHHPALQRTVTFEWPPFQSDAQAIGAYLMNATNDGGRAQYLLTALVILGAITSFRRQQERWLVFAWALMGALYVITSSTSSAFRNILTGFWYHDSHRLLGAAPIVAIPLAAMSLNMLVTQLVRRWPRVRSTSVATFVCVLIVCVATGLGPGLRMQRSYFHDQTQLGQKWFLQDDEYAFLQEVAEVVADDEEVANYPYDGSAYAYSLFDVDVYFKDYDANWIGTPTPDIDTIRHSLNQASTDPAVCEVVDKYNIRYALTMEDNGINTNLGVGVYEGNWTGLEIDPTTPGFEVVMSDQKGNTLYRITACE